MGHREDPADDDYPRGVGDNDDPRFRKMIQLFNALPPEELKELLLETSATELTPALLEAGSTEVVLDVLKELAHHSRRPKVRREARRIIREQQLDLILLTQDEKHRRHRR
ncbi:MAG: hypothetical protein ACRCYQ_16120 [Nocardioides sp.]